MTTTQTTSEPWVDAETVGRHLGFEVTHIRRLAKAGKLPGWPIENGKRIFWRFRLSEIDAFMNTTKGRIVPLLMKQAHA